MNLKTLKGINKYLEELKPTVTIKSVRGNIYNCKIVPYKLLKKLNSFVSVNFQYHEGNGLILINYNNMYLLQLEVGTNKRY